MAIMGRGVWIAESRRRDAAPGSTVEIAKAPEPPPLVEGARKPVPSTVEQAAPAIATAPQPPKALPLAATKAPAPKPAAVETKRAEPAPAPPLRAAEPMPAVREA